MTIKIFKIARYGLAAALSVLFVDETLAHAVLKRAEPGAGAKVSVSPKAVTLEFSEGVVPKLSGIVIRNAAGKTIGTGTPIKGDSAAAVTVPIAQTLPPGTYTVAWHAVSVDTHRTQGRFSFTVAP